MLVKSIIEADPNSRQHPLEEFLFETNRKIKFNYFPYANRNQQRARLNQNARRDNGNT